MEAPRIVFFVFRDCLSKFFLKDLHLFFFVSLFEPQIEFCSRILYLQKQLLIISINVYFEKVFSSQLLYSYLVYLDFVFYQYALCVLGLI